MEDSIEEAFLVKALVESEGLGEVVVAQDGVHGADLGRGGVFDLIVCDLNLPGTDGVEVVRASKQEYPERPIIVTTGYADAIRAIAHCLRLAATGRPLLSKSPSCWR